MKSHVLVAAFLAVSACENLGGEIINDDVLTANCSNVNMTTPGDVAMRCGPQLAKPHTQVE